MEEVKSVSEMLADRKPGDKPRFFLHDEMVAWLKDNLKIHLNVLSNETNILRSKLGVNTDIVTQINIQVITSIAGQNIFTGVHSIHNNGTIDAFSSICGALDKCIFTISDQNRVIASLEERIKILENEKSTLPG